MRIAMSSAVQFGKSPRSAVVKLHTFQQYGNRWQGVAVMRPIAKHVRRSSSAVQIMVEGNGTCLQLGLCR